MNPPCMGTDCLGLLCSGAVYAVRLLECWSKPVHDVHLTISMSARDVLKQELNVHVDLNEFDVVRSGSDRETWTRDLSPLSRLSGAVGQRIVPDRRHGHLSLFGRYAQFIAYGTAENVIHRAAVSASQGTQKADPGYARNAAIAGSILII